MSRFFSDRAILALMLAAGLFAGCAHPRSRVTWDDSADLSNIRRVGAMPFADPRGKGLAISDAVNAGLPQLTYEQVDAKALRKIFEQHPPGKDNRLGLESVEFLRRETGADAVIMGRMTPDWSALELSMVETEMGSVVMRAFISPEDE